MLSPNDILSFWFEENPKKMWFKGGSHFDSQVRQKFELPSNIIAKSVRAYIQQLGLTLSDNKGKNQAASSLSLPPETLSDWFADESGYLALCLVLDQFPRNMYRDTPAAFAWDDLGVSIAQLAVEKAYDLRVDQERRSFFYMPFMHAENLEMQRRCVELVDQRLDNENTLYHARAHLRLIERFGRFPHRNKSLGRTSSAQEKAFLEQGGYKP